MKDIREALSLLLVISLTLGFFSPIAVASPEPWNLALGCEATASSVANNCPPSWAVDGATGAPQWNSEDMKTASTVNDTDEQIHQWLKVDLGENTSTLTEIKLWYNLKVWPMVYEIQTSDIGDPDAEDWETVVRVERPSSNGLVVNGPDQDIADTTANTDTITSTSNPKLKTNILKRYVRFYCEKVNAKAGGHNINLREIEIFGTNSKFDVKNEIDKWAYIH